MRIRLNEKINLPRVRRDDGKTAERTLPPDNIQALSPERLEHIPIGKLNIPPRVLRNHPRSQIAQIRKSIETFGFLVPIVVDRDNVIRAGIARFLVAKDIRMKTVPVIRTGDLSEAQLRAFQLADNKLAEKSKWNREGLALEIPELRNLLVSESADINLEDIGFEPSEVDQIVLDGEEQTRDPADDIDESHLTNTPVSVREDLWLLGQHRLVCADGRDGKVLKTLLDGDRADMAMLDPPYNVRIKDVVGRGEAKHSEFAMASGEMSDSEFRTFLEQSLSRAASVSRNGAVHYVCMDWRHIGDLMSVGATVYEETLNLAVWVKSNGGQGSFYRSQHELIGVFRVGKAPHLNNVQLGKFGRSRTNVWHYAGVNSFRVGRMDDLNAHPTVKPIALVLDALKDCTKRGDIILDTFCGSGTTILAAERLGRRAMCVEIEPRYVDLAIRRWQEFTGKDAIHAESGRTFNDIETSGRRVRVRRAS